MSLLPVITVTIFIWRYHHCQFHLKQQQHGRQTVAAPCIFSPLFLFQFFFKDSTTFTSIKNRQTIATSCIVSWSLMFTFFSKYATTVSSIENIIIFKGKLFRILYIPLLVTFPIFMQRCYHHRLQQKNRSIEDKKFPRPVRYFGHYCFHFHLMIPSPHILWIGSTPCNPHPHHPWYLPTLSRLHKIPGSCTLPYPPCIDKNQKQHNKFLFLCVLSMYMFGGYKYCWYIYF